MPTHLARGAVIAVVVVIMFLVIPPSDGLVQIKIRKPTTARGDVHVLAETFSVTAGIKPTSNSAITMAT